MPEACATVAFLGDTYLGSQPSIRLSADVRRILADADLVVGNLEGPITDADRAAPGKVCLRSAPETGSVLRDWGVDVVSLANNHMFDFGREGFDQTRRILKDVGVVGFGAGANLAEALTPLIRDVGGVRLGFLACSWEPTQTRRATETDYGAAPLEAGLMADAIGELVQKVDAVIVTPHWGYCRYLLPPPEMVGAGGELLRAGATAVIGHHSHVVQGLALDRDALIAYSLGNFAFAEHDYRGHPLRSMQDSRMGAVLVVRFSPGRVASYEMSHTVQARGVIALDRSGRRQRSFERRCAPVRAADYAKQWRKYLRRRLITRLLHWANPLNLRRLSGSTLSAALQMLKEMIRGRR